MTFHIVNFYRFVALKEPEAIGQQLYSRAKELNLLGKIIISAEGINAALSGELAELQEFCRHLQTVPHFNAIECKWSIGETKPFRRMLLKVKPAIVTFMGAEDPSPDEINSAPRLSPDEWDGWLEREDVVLVDSRNDYECDWGTFDKAEVLPIKKFSEFGQAFVDKYAKEKDKKFLIFCTGGIRCEKVAPWLMRRGFDNVYQLDGGILKYLEEKGSGRFQGSCFVFDQRWALSSELQETDSHAGEKVLQKKPLAPSTET